MFEKWYKIEGINKKLADMWKADLRRDIIIWEENGIVEARIRLNPMEAFRMNHLMTENNKQQPFYKLELVPA